MFAKKSISCIFSVLFVIVVMLAVTPLQGVQAAGVRYAKSAASGAGDCSSWANACSLQTALTGATSGDEIWAAAGTYKPTTGTGRTATFQLKNGVALYGGFAGTETARDQRNPATNATILSGDLNGDDVGFTNNSENVYHVVTGATGATLDGFRIRAGNANGASPNDSGGGVYNTSGSNPTLTNILFQCNSAAWGGGMYNSSGSNPTLTNVFFNYNSAAGGGGGGGMYNSSSSPTLTNVTFSVNEATNYGGGGMYNSSSSPALTNVTFSSNSAWEGGGMYNTSGSNPALTNVTFSDNEAYHGGGMYNTSGSNPTIRNTILWGSIIETQIFNDGSFPVVSDSVVQGGCPAGSTCTNIITVDPRLGPLTGYGIFTWTVPLLAGSSAIDTGNDAVCPTTDQRGVTRPQGAHCDIGAYEYYPVINYIYHVKPVASGTGDCLSWANACTLQNALTTAISGDEIWAAAGTHKPTTGTDRTATFQLKSGVALYGGFAGTETARDQRNPAVNVTILSGDLNSNDVGFTNNSENSVHVVIGATGATLDGFAIRAGNANSGTTCPGLACGGGMYNTSGSSPTLTNVTFSGNWADIGGGGMYNTSGSSPTLTNVTFSGNTAYSGLGGGGGGMYNDSSSPTLTNVTFSGNSANNGDGGGMYNDSSSPTLTNVTFSGNSAWDGGGGMYNTSGSPTISNTIFWGNTAYTEAQIFNGSSSPVVSDSVVQGGCPAGSTCTNIITTDPRLGPLGDYGYGGSTQTIPLLPGSSAIDTGNDTICPATDQRGLARPQGAHCDIGAYEYDYLVFPIYHVKPVASGAGNCSSWANACPLQSALGTIASGDEIWAAAGTHKPTTDPANRYATFQLKSGVTLYGGFAATETTRDQRNPAVNVTILSGDIDSNDSQTPIITDTTTVTGNTTNSYQVVTGVTGATLDGFTITAGNANLDNFCSPHCVTNGGGMYNASGSSPTVTNVTFSGNSAYGGGGGMYNSFSSPTLTNVTFSGNSAAGSSGTGGGMYNSSSSPTLTNVTFSGNSANSVGGGLYNGSGGPTLTNVTFSDNSAKSGGGLYNGSGSPTLTNVTFSGNSANYGGGMTNEYSITPTLTSVSFNGNTATLAGGGMFNSYSTPALANVTFSSNSANNGGGMFNNPGSSPTLTNTTFNGNTAANDGGGMYNSSSSPALTNVTFSGNAAVYGGGMRNGNSSNPQIRNTIFWSNTASSAGAQIYNGGGSPVVSDSVVQAGCPAGITCTNIITTDPVLGTLGNYGGSTQTIPLLSGSSAIDKGNDAICPATDQRGMARPHGAHCDIGAYEFYELDTTPPMVNSITRLNPSPTSLASVGFTVTFSESVTGVDMSDFSLTTAGISGASVTGVSGSGSVYTVTVNTGTGTGTLRLDVTDDDSIVDMAGNPLGGTGTGNGNFTSGETYDVRFHLIYLPLVLRN